MSKVSRMSKNTPLVMVGLLVLAIATILLGALFTKFFSFTGNLADSFGKIVSIIILLVIMKLLHLLYTLKFDTRRFALGLLLGCYIIIAMFANLSAGVTEPITLKPLLFVIVVNVIVGIWEEVLCRGIIFNVMLKRVSPMKAVMLSSVIFSLAHVINFFTEDTHPILITSQIVYTFFLGVFFAGIYYATKSLWAVITLHALLNISSDIPGIFSKQVESPADAATVQPVAVPLMDVLVSGVATVVIMVPAFVIGIIITKKKMKKEGY